MATQVSTLQSRIAANLGLDVGDRFVSETELLGDINQVYRFDIVDATASRRFAVNVAQSLLIAPVSVLDLTGTYSALLEGPVSFKASGDANVTRVRVYTDPNAFWTDYDQADTTEGRPEAVLLRGPIMDIRPFTDVIYTAYFTALQYRTALAQGGSMTRDQEAKAVEYAATVYAAARLGDDDARSRYTDLSGLMFDKLRAEDARNMREGPRVGRMF